MSGQKCSHGRGGAGNIRTDTVTYVDGLTYSPPVLKEIYHPRYSTGIGGAGNIRKFNAAEVRLAQDVPDGPFHVPRATAAGRGGWGNIQEMRKRERLAREAMSSDSRSSFESQSSESSSESQGSSTSSTSESGNSNWGKNLFLRLSLSKA